MFYLLFNQYLEAYLNSIDFILRCFQLNFIVINVLGLVLKNWLMTMQINDKNCIHGSKMQFGKIIKMGYSFLDNSKRCFEED